MTTKRVTFNVEINQIREFSRVPTEEKLNFWVSKADVDMCRQEMQVEAMMEEAREMVKRTILQTNGGADAVDNDELERMVEKVVNGGLDNVLDFLLAHGVSFESPTIQTNVEHPPPLTNNQRNPENQVRKMVRHKLILEQTEPFLSQDTLKNQVNEIMKLPKTQILAFLEQSTSKSPAQSKDATIRELVREKIFETFDGFETSDPTVERAVDQIMQLPKGQIRDFLEAPAMLKEELTDDSEVVTEEPDRMKQTEVFMDPDGVEYTEDQFILHCITSSEDVEEEEEEEEFISNFLSADNDAIFENLETYNMDEMLKANEEDTHDVDEAMSKPSEEDDVMIKTLVESPPRVTLQSEFIPMYDEENSDVETNDDTLMDTTEEIEPESSSSIPSESIEFAGKLSLVRPNEYFSQSAKESTPLLNSQNSMEVLEKNEGPEMRWKEILVVAIFPGLIILSLVFYFWRIKLTPLI